MGIQPSVQHLAPIAMYRDFLYSASVTQTALSEDSLSLYFGDNLDGDPLWEVRFDFAKGLIGIGCGDLHDLKTASYPFALNQTYRLRVLVNDNLVKVYVDEGDSALLIFGMEGYKEGYVYSTVKESLFAYEDETVLNLNTATGDFFIGGFDETQVKVLNLSDGNYRLDEEEYSLDYGVLTIDEAYLNTLETNQEYKFRAVTPWTDFDFYVKTDEVGVAATPTVEKFYRGNDVGIALSEPSLVSKVLIDGEEFAFSQNAQLDLVTVSSLSLEPLPSGEHTAKVFTQNGRPEARFSLYSTAEVIPEIPAPVNYAYFFIDVGIFAALIIGYVTFSQISKRNGKKQ